MYKRVGYSEYPDTQMLNSNLYAMYKTVHCHCLLSTLLYLFMSEPTNDNTPEKTDLETVQEEKPEEPKETEKKETNPKST